MLKKFFKALIPSIILGFLFWFLIALTQGMNKINQTPGMWFFLGFSLFELLLVLVSNGERIFGRFFKYIAYEFWALPIMMVIYTFSSVGQASETVGTAGAIGAGIGGGISVIIAVVVGGFGGLIFFLIGSAINRKSKVDSL